MARRLVVGAMFAGAISAVIGVSALLARSSGASDAVADPTAHDPVKVAGKAAGAGDVRETTLHAAHLRGAEPLACANCHSFAADEFTPPDRDRCLGCHEERKAALHAAVDNEDVRQCRRCHDFLDSRPMAEAAWQCLDCHDKPHEGRMLMGTGTTAEICGRCHSPHGEESQAPTACIGCHEDRVNQHRVSLDTTKSCLACHRQHDDKRLANDRCAGCHRDTRPIVPATATFAGHDRCTGCHQPHEFSRKSVKACASCHTTQKALAADHVDAHRNCRSCHDQHSVKSASDQSCKRCHERLAPAHPRNERGDHCLGCHPAHPESRAVARACSTCHQAAHDDRSFHRGARCSDCHREHDFKLTAQPSLCLGCHAGRVGQRAPVVTSAGHAECAKCHGSNAHAPARPPACGTCHQDQASTAPKGHASCMNCHEQHSGTLRRRAATCTSCHTDRRVGPHAGIQGGCSNCHRPHGPDGMARPPACNTCHKPGSLPGLHEVAKHGTCTSCHSSHKPPAPTTATCRGCHTEKKDHEPTATSCIGCHLFTRGDP